MYQMTEQQNKLFNKMYPGAASFMIECSNINEYRYYRDNELILNAYQKTRMAELECMYKDIGYMTIDGQWTELYYQSKI